MGASRATLRLAAAVAVPAVLVAGCGRGAPKLVAPTPVPVSLVPSSLSNGDFTLAEYDKAKKDFADAGPKSLVSDGRLWEIRQGSTLVGTLQVSTLKPKIDIAHVSTRKAIIDQVMPGAPITIKVNGITIASTTTTDKSTYVWFGQELFELLQLKGNNIDPEKVLDELIGFQKPSGKLVVRRAKH